MDVVGGIVAHRDEVETLEEAQLLQEDRPLRPRLAFVDGDAAVVRTDRRFDFGSEGGKVTRCEQAAVSIGPFNNIACDIAAIKPIARRVDRGFASAVAGRRFGVGQAAKKVRQRWIADDIAGVRQFAAGHIYGGAGRPLLAKFLRVEADRRGADKSRQILRGFSVAG